MKLSEALNMGYGCGLEEVEECVDNIRGHALNLFLYPEIKAELTELYAEYELFKKGELILDMDSIKKSAMKWKSEYEQQIRADYASRWDRQLPQK